MPLETDIQEAAKARIDVAGQTVPVGQTYEDRVYPLDQFPTWTVLVTDDVATDEETQGQKGIAIAQVVLEGRAKVNVGADPGLSKTLWTMAAEARSLLILSADNKLGGAGATFAFEWLESRLELNDEGEAPAGKVTIRFAAHHTYLAHDPTTG